MTTKVAQSLMSAVCVLLLATAALGQSAPRYQALLQNGQRVQGKTLADWHEPQRVPRLDGQPLLEQGNPGRWLRDRSLPLSEPPAACVEMHTGDCLPGNVLEARSGLELPFDPLPAHLIVEPRILLEPTKERPVPRLRVETAYVRRIVWQRRRKLEYQPGTLFFRDGRMQKFQAFRLDGMTVQILLEEGAKRIPFGEISELHLPPLAQPWDLHFAELAALCTKPETRLWQLETTQGLIVTGSPERFAPRFEGNPNDSVRWVHALQPAWSLDPLWIPVRDVACWRFFAQHEVPLQRAFDLQQGVTNQSSKETPVARYNTNRNILGGPLRSLTTDFGFGLGLQAPAQLKLSLPPDAVAFRTIVCLDRAAGRGGCARVYFKTAENGPRLWESPLLLGSEVVVDTGRLNLPAKSTQLLIELDSLHSGRPPGADPLDIRDHVNLADGWLELDSAAVQREIGRRLPERIAAWKDWRVAPLNQAPPAPRDLVVSQERRVLDRAEEGFQPGVSLVNRPLILAQELTIEPTDQWLVIAASRIRNQGPPAKLEVWIAGEAAGEFEVPELRSDPNETTPLVVSLLPFRQATARKLNVEIRQLPGPADAAPIRWRAIYATSEHPTSIQLFEDKAQLTRESTGEPGASGQGSATLITSDRFSGRGALELQGPGVYRLGLKASLRIRERPQWGEYRFVRFAVRRPQKQKAKGRLSLEFEPAIGGRRPYRLDTGKGKPAFDSAVRVWDGELPEHWIVITRDLFADFGEFEIRDLHVSCFEGEGLAVDHVYLGRSPADLDRQPQYPSSYEDATTAMKLWKNDIEKRLGPALVGIEFKDGRWTGGAVLRPDGEFIVPGHALGAVNEDVTVHLFDGKTFPARTKGVCRDRDLGMIKADKPPPLAGVPIWDPKEAKLADDYVAMLLPAKLSGGFQVQPVQVEVQQVVRGRMWTTLTAKDWVPGGLLFHRHGYWMGTHVGEHPLGGMLFERPIQGGGPDPFPRMRNGEVFGNWPLGSEPLLGFRLKQAANEAKHHAGLITFIDAIDSPVAAAAGLQPGDAILLCEGKLIHCPADLFTCLEQKDAGQEIALEIERAGAKLPMKLKLGRRVP